MKREELTAKVLEAKRKKGLSWKQIAEAIGPGSPILYTAALLGQMTLTKEESENWMRRKRSSLPNRPIEVRYRLFRRPTL
jgi:cyanate lyase